MKTAHNWFAEHCDSSDTNGQLYWMISERSIAAIQKDALLEAATVVHSMSRGTKSDDRAIAIDNAVSAIIDRVKQLDEDSKLHDKC